MIEMMDAADQIQPRFDGAVLTRRSPADCAARGLAARSWLMLLRDADRDRFRACRDGNRHAAQSDRLIVFEAVVDSGGAIPRKAALPPRGFTPPPAPEAAP